MAIIEHNPRLLATPTRVVLTGLGAGLVVFAATVALLRPRFEVLAFAAPPASDTRVLPSTPAPTRWIVQLPEVYINASLGDEPAEEEVATTLYPASNRNTEPPARR